MLPKDARIDPECGDVLEIKEGCKCVRYVVSVRDGKVKYFSRVGNQWLNSAMTDTLEEWREVMKDAVELR